MGKAKDGAAIKMLFDDWVAAANAGDAAAMAALFTDDGILMLPNEPSVIGKEAIRSHLQAHFDECGGAGHRGRPTLCINLRRTLRLPTKSCALTIAQSVARCPSARGSMIEVMISWPRSSLPTNCSLEGVSGDLTARFRSVGLRRAT